MTFTTNADVRWGHVELRLYGHTGDADLLMNSWFDDIELRPTSPTARMTVGIHQAAPSRVAA